MKPDFDSLLRTFPRPVPVFPLAEVVLFPGAVLPLHIFEPRYQAMLEDALAGDRLIALALLKQCGPAEYEEAPPFHETVCVGHVLHHEGLPDGRSNIAIFGLSAGHAVAADSDAPYRVAEVELLADTFEAAGDFDAKLLAAFRRTVPGGSDLGSLRGQLGELLPEDGIAPALVNTCALTAPILPADKLTLLEERSVARRLDRLLELLERPWQWN